MTTLCRFIALGLLAAACVGCGSSPTLVEAQGTVIGPDGKPLPNVLVMFTPTATGGAKVISSTGVTDETGKFVLTADTGQPGAVLGTHKVTLVDNALATEDEPQAGSRPRPKNRIPPDYSSPATTRLEVTVEAGKTHHELKVR
jgi:hypothetical protein